MTDDSPDDESGRGRPKVELLQLASGALASITAAVLGSRLGVNGTIIGAALGSIVGTVASATYTEFLGRTAARVRTVVGAPGEAVTPQTPTVGGTTQVDRPPLTPAGATQLDPNPPTVTQRHAAAHWQPPAAPRVESAAADSRTRLPWRGVAVGVLATFVVVVGVLTAFELLSGRTLSSFTGGSSEDGTSIGQVLDPAPEVAPTTDLPSPDPTATVTFSPTPTEAPTTLEPSSTVPTTSSPTTTPPTSTPSETSTPTSS